MINSEIKLKLHLRQCKNAMKKSGIDNMMLYPTFCAYYDKKKQNYDLPKEVVLNMACQILIEEE